MKEASGEINVINYEKLDNVNDTYSNLIQKIMISIHILPSIIHIIKVLFQGAILKNQRNSLKCFDSEIPEKLIRDKLFKNTAKNLDFQTKILIKQQKLIAKRRRNSLKTNSESLLVNIKTYGRLLNRSDYLINLVEV